MNTNPTDLISSEKLDEIVTLSRLDKALVVATLNYDWNNSDDHAEWVQEAAAEEIADWARRNAYEQSEERSDLAEQCGGPGANWADVAEWFKGMTVEQILAEADRCWPEEDNNEEFALRVFAEL